jgi:predicted nucleotidyltransferase
MKVVGIIAEYNPLHFGHTYQIQKARELYGPDTPIVAVMSGSFVQRGEPAIAGKWARTQAALSCGIDLVIEIPFTFACASAERFALGAVSLLEATGIITDLYFGSECEDLPLLSSLADILCEESPAFVSFLKENLKEGSSYAKARELALTACLSSEGQTELAEKCGAILKLPNTILAIEYLIALKKTRSEIIPSVLLRSGAGYHDSSLSGLHSSATAIRGAVADDMKSNTFRISNIAEQLAGKMPAGALAPILSEWSGGIRPVLFPDFIREAVLALRTRTLQQLDDSAYMGDQLSNRLKNAVAGLRNCSQDDLSTAFRDLAKTKRYAETRINRALISLLCGQTSDDLTALSSPEYLRILGFSERGRYLLRLMRKTATLPQIDKASDFLEYGANEKLIRMSELDIISSDIWSLKAGYAYGDEYERSVIRSKGRK